MDTLRHPVLNDLEPEPSVLRTLAAKEVRDTHALDLRQPGYRRALKLVRNRDGKGELVNNLADKLNCEPESLILFTREGFQDMFKRVHYEAVHQFGEVDVVQFPTPHRGLDRLRDWVPHTVPLSVSRNALKFHDSIFKKFHGRRRLNLRGSALQFLPNSISEQTQSALLRGIALDNFIFKEYIRAEIKDMRNLPLDMDISLYAGATAAEDVIFALLSRSGDRTPQTAIQKHEFDLAIHAAISLNHDVRRMVVPYGHVQDTEIPPGTEVVYLSVPNNPTGLTMNIDEIDTLLNKINPIISENSNDPSEITIIIDVVGYDTTNNKRQFVKDLYEVAIRKPHRIVIVDSMSKSEALAEERIGYAWSNRPAFNDQLRENEMPFMSPMTVRAFRKRKNHMKRVDSKRRDFREQTAAYLQSFHSTLQEIIKRSGGDVHIYKPKDSIQDPSGYYVTLGFRTPALASHFLNKLEHYGFAKQYEDSKGRALHINTVVQPLTGIGRPGRTPSPGQRITLDNQTRGMPFLDKKYVRICAAGQAFVLAALADAIGMK